MKKDISVNLSEGKESANYSNVHIKKNEYSIYDYFKKTPSVFIGAVSTIVAIVTFFAKFGTLVSARRELAFWGVDPSCATFGDEPLVYTVIISILHVFSTAVSVMWFKSTYEAYLPYKKFYLIAHYYKNIRKKEIKQIKQKSKNKKITKEDQADLEIFEELCKAIREVKRDSLGDLLFNFLPPFLVLCVVSFIFITATVSESIANILGWAIISAGTQTVALYLSMTISSEIAIKKKELKKNVLDMERMLKLKDECNFERYPLANLFRNGFRPVMKNSNILTIVSTLLVSCLILCFVPQDSVKGFQITTIDEKPYMIIHRNNNQYILEEVEIQEDESACKTECILVVYTNRQRFIKTDDIVVSTFEFDDIVRKCKSENTYIV